MSGPAEQGDRQDPANGSRKRKKRSEERDTSPPPAPEPLPAPVADSHTHIDMQAPDTEDVVAAADAVNVRTLIQVGVDVPSSLNAAAMGERYERIWGTVALHPNEAPRLVLGDPDGWSGQHRPPGGRAVL